jgi:hypothetical protein
MREQQNFRPEAYHLALIEDPEKRAREILATLIRIYGEGYDKGSLKHNIGTFELPSGRKMKIKESVNNEED